MSSIHRNRWRNPAIHAPLQKRWIYANLGSAAVQIDIWETEYYHIVDGAQDIVTWFRGTGLRPFLEALESDTHRLDFEQQVLEGYTRAYPSQPDGRVLFPFRRLFMVAYH